MLMKKSMNELSYSISMAKALIEDTQDILSNLESNDIELPLWWTNKLAVSSAYLNSLRDYIVFNCCESEENESEEPNEELEPEEQTEVEESSEAITESEDTTEGDTEAEDIVEIASEMTDDYMLPPSARMVMRSAT